MARLSVPETADLEPNIFRSEEMMYIQIYMQPDAAHLTMEELGRAGVLQLVDKNPTLSAFQRPFAGDVKRCEEIQRKLRYFQSLLENERVSATATPAQGVSLNDIESHVSDLEQHLRMESSQIEAMVSSLSQKEELSVVLKACDTLLADASSFTPSAPQSSSDVRETLLENDAEQSRGEGFFRVRTICGTIAEDKTKALERLLFRVTRGNCLVRFADQSTSVTDSRLNVVVEKRPFAVFHSGERVGDKIVKIIDAIGGTRYQFESSREKRMQLLQELAQTIIDMKAVLEQSRVSRRQQLLTIARSLSWWEEIVRDNKAIFHALNKFEFDGKRAGMVGEGWCPRRQFNTVKRALQAGAERSGVAARAVCDETRPHSKPPTYFKTNKLTAPFQAIVDAYGIPDYRELNPTPFLVTTFPFLFAVMFGDVGHGFLLLLFSLFMIAREQHFLKNKPGEIFGMMFGGRYVLLLMSIFSIYTGFLYNEVFSLSMNLFDSPYKYSVDKYGNMTSNFDNLPHVYPFGVDPIWKQTDNELTFTNSMKMKMSVIFGVTQMLFGVVLSAFNHVYFNDMISLINQFIPQVVFLSSVFGYMVLLIFKKWTMSFPGTTKYCSPDILATFISFFIQMGSLPPSADDVLCPKETAAILPMHVQSILQKVLLGVALLSVPWMLLGKPLLLNMKHKKKRNHLAGSHVVPTSDSQLADPVMHDDHHEFDFGEEMVHNLIHTIEFVLGCVSNTASYLRLWALSLAHGQLSVVFWEKTMVSGLTTSGSIMSPIMIVAGFFMWLMFTFGVLMIMESLSAFLHALRLHWVEFQNKFYHGAGVKFIPFRLDSTGQEE